jgi:hypothetical protein
MAVRYCHTQRGTLLIVVMLIAAVAAASLAYLIPRQAWLQGALAIGFAALAWLFSSLSVEVTESEIRWHFGPGIWRYRIARTDIESVRIVRNSWLDGFGIRVRPGYRLYNVSGLDAVELRLKMGVIRRIGTDDAQALAGALTS